MAPKRNCLVEALARNPRGAVAGDGPPLGPQPIAGADEVAVPNRRTNREKLADLKRQGLTQAQVVKALGICKSRVSQLWPRTPEVQAVFAEEHAAEVREATAQRSFADVEVRPADADAGHAPAPPTTSLEDMGADTEASSDAGGPLRQRLPRKRAAAPDANEQEAEPDPVGPLLPRMRWPRGKLQPGEPPAKSQRLVGKKAAAEHAAEGRVVGAAPDAGAVADDDRDAPPPPAPVVMRRPASKQSPAHLCKGFAAAGSACVFSTVSPGTQATAVRTARCVICCPERLAQALATSQGKQNIKLTLKAFLRKDRRDIFDLALARLPEDKQDEFANAAGLDECRGSIGAAAPCIFASDRPGCPANCRPHPRCVLCCPERMTTALATPRGKQHITLWLDIPNMPAAAYVALSRVEYDANWRFVGDPWVHHFTPAVR